MGCIIILGRTKKGLVGVDRLSCVYAQKSPDWRLSFAN